MTARKPPVRAVYTVAELAGMMGISPWRIRSLLRAHGVRTVSRGSRKWLVALSELREKLWPMLDSWQMAEMARKVSGDDGD